jgi:transposase
MASLLLLLLVFSPWAGLAETTAQSGDRYGSGTLRSRQALRDSLPLLSPAFRRSHSRRQMPPRPQQRQRS